MSAGPRVAFVHEWLVTLGGSEKVLEAQLECFPGSPVHALVVDRSGGALKETGIGRHPIIESFLRYVPFSHRYHRLLLGWMPMAVEQFDLSGYDVVVSSHHAVANGALTTAEQLHISYVHSPMRYAWDLCHDYAAAHPIAGLLARPLLHRLRQWDLLASFRVDHFIANSHCVARRIAKTYRRSATVIHPPVDTDAFAVGQGKDDYFVTASRMVPYKKIGLIVEAFRLMPKRKLVVIGGGPGLRALRAAAPANVELLGHQPFDVLRGHLQRARAFIFAAEEDFGILPVEAQACGTPVIAYGRGGSLETVIDGVTGMHFFEQTSSAIAAAVAAFAERPASDFPVERIRAHAERFSVQRFNREFTDFIHRSWDAFRRGGPPLQKGPRGGIGPQ